MGAHPNWNLDLPPKYAAFPLELRALAQWVVWKRVMKDGASKPTKVPYAALTSRAASATDPCSWATFDAAVAAAAANVAYAGIGFVFTENDPYVGIDLDNCIDETTGELTAEASSIVTAIDSYTERTPSGKGLHIIARGKLPPEGRKKGNIEMYESGRYFTVTGDQWPGTDGAVADRPAEVTDLHERVFGRAKASESAKSTVRPALVATNATDDHVLATIRASMNAAKFGPLFAGTWGPPIHPSQSEADLALCAILATHCVGDEEQIDRLFRRSGLYRDKWDENRGDKTYGQKTIDKALQNDLDSEDCAAANADDHAADAKAQALTKFNERFAVVRAGSSSRILEEHRDGTGRVERVSLLNQADFALTVKNWPNPAKKRGDPGNWWLGQPARREYSSIDFKPGGAKDGEYNL